MPPRARHACLPYPRRVTEPRGDWFRFEHSGGGGRYWIEVSLTEGTILWKGGGESPRPLDPADLERLRALAATVRPEHARLQPSHLTYAQDERLDVVLAGARVSIDAASGEIAEGPPSTLVELAGAIVRGLRAHANDEGAS